ncbi:MAG: acetate/propionate family kinase [Ilumatobacter sp.]|uniref:acetate/propionate family kinase n=1 Tax=Ilumatobacter sp. TaxID=1967498 RepID=UPI003C715931
MTADVVFVANAGSGTIDCTAFQLDAAGHGAAEAVWQLDVVRHSDPQMVTVAANGTTIEFEAKAGNLAAAIDPALPMLWTGPTSVVHSPDRVRAVGHRIVHGGDANGPRSLDAATLDEIRRNSRFAPLHNPPGLELIDLVSRAIPDVEGVAVFDTSFHRTIPTSSAAYGGPLSWIEEGLHRYGFHGISHENVAHRTAEILDRPLEDLELISVHLGGGCSATAVRFGASVDTTMGLTPTDGMVMAARSGSVDPGLLLYLIRRDDLDVDQLESLLNRDSGLMGLTAGATGDIARVSEGADDDAVFALARDVYVRAAARSIAAMRTSLDALDAITFTGGAAASAPEVVAAIVRRLAHLGIDVDPSRVDVRHRGGGDRVVSSDTSAVTALLLRADENRAIADAVVRHRDLGPTVA